MPQGDLHRLHRPDEPRLPEGQAGQPPPGGSAIAPVRLDVGEAVLPTGRVAPASLLLDGGVVVAAGGPAGVGEVAGAEVVSRPELSAVPGLVDLQCNGGGGRSFWDGPAPETFDHLLRTGVTSVCPTLPTGPAEGYRPALEALAGAPRSLGVHLEGPFLHPARRGAHPPEHLLAPDPEWALSLLDAAPVAVWTLAPELPGALDLVEALAGRGVVVSAGHSEATYEQVREAADRGLSMVTHLFNGQAPLHHREPGVVGAALDLPLSVGLILDGVHVREEVAKAALTVLGERAFAVTDAVAAAGVSAEAPRLPDGTLAGSAAGMDECLRRAVRLVGLERAVRLCATTPAAAVGRPDLGVLRPGAAADVVLLERDLGVGEVWVAGERVR